MQTKKNTTGEKWDIVLKPGKSLWDINFRELWEYRDLLFLLVKRDIIVVYKQTIFGPVWYFVQPLLTMIVYIIVFSNIARIPTDGIPPPVFYLAGIIVWNYFHECFMETSDVFYKNASIFQKIYFPRILVPVSKVISAIIQLLIQTSLFIVVYLYYINTGSVINIQIDLIFILVPYLLVLVAGLGLGAGLVLSALTAKYRDLTFVIKFGMQLLMYASPVIYPMSIIPEQYRSLMAWNPMAHIIEGFKHAVFGTGVIATSSLVYTSVVTLIILVSGVIIFNKTEQTFSDSV